MPAAPQTLDGHWLGALRMRSRDEEARLLVQIDGESVRICAYEAASGGWIEPMPGRFRAVRDGSNAVIHGSHDGTDKDGRWVETWTLTMTPVDNDAALTEWVRVVNNIDQPSQASKFSETAGGTLARSAATCRDK